MAELIVGIVAAAITGGPAWFALRRTRGTVRAEGEATREAVETTMRHAVDLLKVEMREVRRDVRRLEDWQTSHTAEHILIRREHGGR